MIQIAKAFPVTYLIHPTKTRDSLYGEHTPFSDDTESGRQPRGNNWNEKLDDAIVNLLPTRWKELGFGSNRFRNREIGVFDINVLTLFLCPYECNQLAFLHIDRSRLYLFFELHTCPKSPLATFIDYFEVTRFPQTLSFHFSNPLSTLIS